MKRRTCGSDNHVKNTENINKEVYSMKNEYLNDLNQEFNLDEIERKLNSTIEQEELVKANEFFLLAMVQMRFSH